MGKMLVFASALSAATVMADDLVVDSHDHWQSFQNSYVLRAGRANPVAAPKTPTRTMTPGCGNAAVVGIGVPSDLIAVGLITPTNPACACVAGEHFIERAVAIVL